MNWWEVILAGLLVLILFSAGILLRPGVRTSRDAGDEFKLWLAQGFGVGRIPWAPGTFGSIVGLAWFALLLASGRWWFFLAGSLGGVALSVWLCGVAEDRLGRKDPGSVVLDEIAAMPLCFVAWIWLATRHTSSWIFPVDLFSGNNWLPVLAVFACFRLFDVWKPWPARQSQALPRGWGITIDDVIAAAYVNLVVLLVYAGRTMLAR
jgi:phosphatidylglycerophosphatase A